MNITFDPAKREKTLLERGVDFMDAPKVFAGLTYTVEDTRRDYGEPRYLTIGFLGGRMVMIAWTPRQDARRIISMRKVNDRETKRYGEFFD